MKRKGVSDQDPEKKREKTIDNVSTTVTRLCDDSAIGQLPERTAGRQDGRTGRTAGRQDERTRRRDNQLTRILAMCECRMFFLTTVDLKSTLSTTRTK